MCGTPVIVADDCGSGQLIRQSGAGYLVPPGNVDALVDNIEQVFSNPDEAFIKVKLGQAFIAQKLDWKNIALDLEQLYQLAARNQESER